MYNVPLLTKAVRHIEVVRRERLEAAQEKAPIALDDSLRAFFALMGAVPPEKAAGLGYCISAAEKVVLCEYLFTEAKESEIETLGSALTEDMDPESAAGIYRQCLRHYDDENYMPLFRKLRSNLPYIEAVSAAFGIRPEPVFSALEEGDLPEYLNNEAGQDAKKGEGGYLDALTHFGVEEGTKLSEECAKLYVTVCSADEYRRMGVSALMKMTAAFPKEYKIKLLRNMLVMLDAFQLRAFVPMLDDFTKLTGNKDSGSYKETLGGLSEASICKYDEWTNEFRIRNVLGDGPVADFWYDYVKDAAVIEPEKLDTLIFDFGGFVVIEIFENEAAYFYDKEYYKDTVSTGIDKAGSGSELENWLREKTEWSSAGDHQNHWRKAHAGKWQLSFHEYISKNS